MRKWLPVVNRLRNNTLKLGAVLIIAALSSAPFCRGQQALAEFSSASFRVDDSITTARYSQTGSGLSLGPTVAMADTIGGLFLLPFVADFSIGQLGVVMRRSGGPQNLPFTIELYGYDTDPSELRSLAAYQGETTSVGTSEIFVPLGPAPADPNASQATHQIILPEGPITIAGCQFTWDSSAESGSVNYEIVGLALILPSEPPDPTPAPTPEPPPIAQQSAAPLAPVVSINSPLTTRQSAYRLKLSVTDGNNPTNVRYRVRAPGQRKFGRWLTAALSDDLTVKQSAPRLRLNKRGRWQVEMQVTDASGQTTRKVIQIRRR